MKALLSKFWKGLGRVLTIERFVLALFVLAALIHYTEYLTAAHLRDPKAPIFLMATAWYVVLLSLFSWMFRVFDLADRERERARKERWDRINAEYKADTARHEENMRRLKESEEQITRLADKIKKGE